MQLLAGLSSLSVGPHDMTKDSMLALPVRISFTAATSKECHRLCSPFLNIIQFSNAYVYFFKDLSSSNAALDGNTELPSSEDEDNNNESFR